ncbi:hypothetical protein KFU94_25855 [Chloroflexi bacterium TSY]|nr:hypothetical protein [Chloroflexi bacterium TSY]
MAPTQIRDTTPSDGALPAPDIAEQEGTDHESLDKQSVVNDPEQTLGLETAASVLAKAHAVVMQPGSYTWFVNRVQQYKSTLQHVYDTITVASKEEALLSYGAEWILDNFYIVQRVLRQIDEDMPEAYYRQLPKLTTTPNQGLPRVYAIAAGIIAQTDLHIDEDRIQRFVLAYQEAVPPSETPLTMGELWALSPMLRFVLLDHLSHAAANIANIDAKFSTNDGRPSDGTLAGDIIANAILGLRLLAVLDWKLFFEEVSTVEKILRRDPIGIYAKMDFETRNAYRKDIESIARMTKCSEVEIASAAIELAGDAGTAQPRFSHVGTYLIGDGKRLLEDKIGHGPSLLRHLQRWFVDHPTFVYLGSIGLLPLLTLYGVVGYTDSVGGSWLWQVGAAILVLLPLLTTSVTLINWLITTFTPPHVLPKLDFAESIPPDCRTMVVVPSMITSEDEVDALLRQLEQHFLGNPDLQLTFALLTDWADAPQEQMPNDEPLLKKAKDGIQTLNLRYASDDGRTPFYLFHRARCWNAGENAWMGWERKRGKLDEFNRLLAGDASTTYIVQEGDRTILPEIKYVITLDADTVLPSATAHRLVGALAHPLNQAEFDAQSGRVVTGYTVLQPRTEIKPTSASRSRFTKIYAGDTGLDLYTLAVSDIYQDLFGEGIYTGKGIYDVAAFRRSLDGRVPNNHILSHDLFEGIHGRAGLLSDVVLYEELPTSYLNYALRSHRWVRGDWQLLPWLFSRVPLADGSKQPNRLSLIDRWKIHDNLCRSLFAPALLTLLVAGWLWMPGSPLVWTLVALLALFSSAITGLIGDVLAQTRESKRTDHGRSLRLQVKRSLLAIVFLPYEASIAADAIVRTITRLIKTRHHLLQWRTAAHTARATRSGIAASWQQMRLSPLLAILIGMAVVGIRPSAILLATPFIFSWVFAPQIAFWISRPTEDVRAELSASQHQSLRCLARRTWLYTEHFVSPDDNWLPPDHFQEAPRGQVAHRTSPTNVGLALLSTLAAYDLGYVGLFELSLRLQNTFDELAKLERHRGHFLNWIDTRTLEPLPPRYVSTVDSGNLAGCLLALSQGCQALSHAPLFRWSRWQDLIDLLTILDETLANASVELLPVTEPLRNHIAGICAQITAARTTPQGWIALLYQLRDKECRELDRLMLELVADHEHTLDADLLHSLRIWMERVHHHLNNRPREIEHLLPWLISFREPPALFNMPHIPAAVIESWQNLVDLRPTQIALNEVVDICLTMQEKLAELQKDLHKQSELTVDEDQELWIAADQWCATLATKLEAAKNNASNLFQHYHALSQLAETYVAEMDFQFLFDERRQLFHIGYNVESGQLDANYYDLLASEARIASLIAIAKQDVPQSHWLHMARPGNLW